MKRIPESTAVEGLQHTDTDRELRCKRGGELPSGEFLGFCQFCAVALRRDPAVLSQGVSQIPNHDSMQCCHSSYEI